MKRMPRILLLFLDGVGIGKKDNKINPFFRANLPIMQTFWNGIVPHLRDARRENSIVSLAPIDATLGIPNIPQSGTGQSSLLTGINAPQLIGKHFGPYLYSSLKPIVAENNIFKQLAEKGHKCFYANAFPRQYFEYLKAKNRPTAITYAWLSSGGKLNDSKSLESAESISADITNQRWHQLGYPQIPIVQPRTAGIRLSNMLEKYDFVIYEYFFTDHAGHSQSMKEAVAILETLDEFIGGIIQEFDLKSNIFVITSDHGNIEDLSTKSHTRNPVPFIVYGKYHRKIALAAKEITDVAKIIVEQLE